MNKKLNKNIIQKIKLTDKKTDFAYWQTQSFESRLEALETIREEYNSWKYGSKQGFQRVYRVIHLQEK